MFWQCCKNTISAAHHFRIFACNPLKKFWFAFVAVSNAKNISLQGQESKDSCIPSTLFEFCKLICIKSSPFLRIRIWIPMIIMVLDWNPKEFEYIFYTVKFDFSCLNAMLWSRSIMIISKYIIMNFIIKTIFVSTIFESTIFVRTLFVSTIFVSTIFVSIIFVSTIFVSTIFTQIHKSIHKYPNLIDQ